MRKEVCLSFILIEFYVQALTPRLNRTDISLQLSEYLTAFAVCRIYAGAVCRET
jgi:hypothetical protein